MVTVCAMTATIMQALDTTVANVALPYMQGSLSASLDQVSWVLTSYIVASAIMTAPIGWLASRFGRKKLFILCATGFTVASVMCGLSQDITQMVLLALSCRACSARRWCRCRNRPMLDALRAARAHHRNVDLGHGRDAGTDHGPDARRMDHRDL